jgi:hypothetical protein
VVAVAFSARGAMKGWNLVDRGPVEPFLDPGAGAAF